LIRFALAALVLAFAAGIPGGEARADPYRWCADYSGNGLGGSRNCYFLTLQQCRATVSGVGGTCTPNPFYTGPAGEPRPAPRGARPRYYY
jgi:hypothetical protein